MGIHTSPTCRGNPTPRRLVMAMNCLLCFLQAPPLMAGSEDAAAAVHLPHTPPALVMPGVQVERHPCKVEWRRGVSDSGGTAFLTFTLTQNDCNAMRLRPPSKKVLFLRRNQMHVRRETCLYPWCTVNLAAHPVNTTVSQLELCLGLVHVFCC
jgi:hypothetical protein